MGLRDYLSQLRKSLWIVLVTLILLGLLVSLGIHYFLDSSKTLWDFLEIVLETLMIPLSLVLFGFFLQSIQGKKEAEQKKNQEFISKEKSKDEILQIFFDRISYLLIDDELIRIFSIPINQLTNEQRSRIKSVKAVMLARTSSVLSTLSGDGKRKGSAIKFLRASGAISSISDVSRVDSQSSSKLEIDLSNENIDLSYAHLKCANLASLELEGVNFSKANLHQSSLIRANLAKANLNKADLSQSALMLANLSRADLSDANLHYANLEQANLEHANLCNANMIGTKLIDANLSGANLSEAQFRGESLIAVDYADLRGANLRDAVLCSADLIGVDLRNADLTRANLRNIKFNLEEIREGKYKYPPTQWPSKEKVMHALNIPDDLRRHLGIFSETEIT